MTVGALGDSIANTQAWMGHALCAQTDPEIFFPGKGVSNRAAKQTCLACPVRQECLEYALAHHEYIGIWGGLSAKERRPLYRPSGPAVRIHEPRVLRDPIITAQCGTPAGVKAHWRRDERCCDSCATARDETFTQLRAAKPGRAV